MTDAPDYGEPWVPFDDHGLSQIDDRDSRTVVSDGFNASELRDRAIACVNACFGIANPERVITRLFESEDELDRLAREVAELDLDNPYLGLAVKQVQKSAKEILAVLQPKREGE